MKNFFLPAIFALLISAASVSAATFTVTNTNDSGAGSLRQAVLNANAAGDDVINFDSSFNTPRTITLTSTITITGSGALTINGPGANLLTISGGNAVRIFEVSNVNSASLGAVIFNNMTIANALSAPSGAGQGAGIGINNGNAPVSAITIVTVNNVAFRNNQAGVNEGGAIGCSRGGTVNVNNSVFTGNDGNNGVINGGSGIGSCEINIAGSSFYENNRIGGSNVLVCCGNGLGSVSINSSAFYNNGPSDGPTIAFLGGNITMTNTTVANNRGSGTAVLLGLNGSFSGILTNVTIAGNYGANPQQAGGLRFYGGGTPNVGNSIVANNYNPTGKADLQIDNSFNSLGYNIFESVGGTIGGNTTGNLIGVDPLLDGVLRDNGGVTKTLALRPGSPAIDAGNPSVFPSTDQRGFARPQDGNGDGASRSDIGAYERRPNDAVFTDKADFDGDGKTDLSIFRPAPGEWWYLKSSNNGNFAAQFGASTDRITPGDFTGDGKSDFAFYRPSTGQWFILRSENLSFYAFPFGTNGDIPVPADYDGDGKTDPAVFRPSNNVWYIQKSSGGTDFISFGTNGDKPVSADFDGDGKADIGVYRNNNGNSEWWIRRSSNGTTLAVQFGISTDKAVPGDYTGDGKADIAFWRPSTGQWFILRSEDSSYYGFPFGSNGDLPSPSDYDGDGKFDPAVFRPSNAVWYIDRTTGETLIAPFGISTDQSVPATFVQ